MSAGKYRELIEIQELTEEVDEYSDVAESYETVATVYAQVVAKGGAEKDVANQTVNEATLEITIRYRSDLTAKHQIIYRGQELSILSYTPKDPKRTELLLVCLGKVA